MKNKFSFLLLIFALTNCSDEKSRDNFEYSKKLCGGVTLETFKLPSDNPRTKFGEWLTDSVTFRQFIGTTDNNYFTMWVECLGDTFIITKRDTIKEIEVKSYRLTNLRQLDNYDK
jgi:hypothetical protein